MKDLQIHSVQLFKAVSILKKPIADSTHHLRELSFLVMRIRLHNGIVGESYMLSFQYSPKAIAGALADAIPHLIGTPVYAMGSVHHTLQHQSEYFGNQGINRWAQAAANVAMWDAWAKYLGQPVHRVLGTCQERVDMYGSGGWLSYSTDELIAEVMDYKNRGFRAVKIKVGSPNWRTDLERLTQVRAAVGNDINIMMDANQGMTLPAALQLAVAAANLNVHWFEEPVDHQDFQAFQSLKARTSISLAMGEREYDTLALKTLLQTNALDIWQPDLLRIGGVDEWRKSAALAEAYHVPVLPHYYKDYDVPLLCTIPNGVGAESFDWVDSLIDNPMLIKDGYAHPHERPGWGFSFIDDTLTEIPVF